MPQPLFLSIMITANSNPQPLPDTSSIDAARAALAEAGAITAAVDVGPDSELGLDLARFRDLLGPCDVRELAAPVAG